MYYINAKLLEKSFKYCIQDVVHYAYNIIYYMHNILCIIRKFTDGEKTVEDESTNAIPAIYLFIIKITPELQDKQKQKHNT